MGIPDLCIMMTSAFTAMNPGHFSRDEMISSEIEDMMSNLVMTMERED
jgi:hypothetical protein